MARMATARDRGCSAVRSGWLIALSAQRREVMIAWRWKLRLPPAGVAVQQLIISAVDLLASAAALWLLLPPGAVEPPAFVAWYSIALVLGLISHVPAALRQLLEESTHQDRARAFAGRHRGFRTNVAAARAAALIERQLSPAALH